LTHPHLEEPPEPSGSRAALDEVSLFRPESIEASRNRSGRPVGNQGVATWLILTFMSLLFICALTFVSVARYTKKETVLGQVVPSEGVVRAAPIKGGVVTDVWVASGDSVTKDQPLFSVSYDPVLEDGRSLGGGVNQTNEEQTVLSRTEGRAKEQQILQRQQLLRERLKELNHEGPGLDAQRAIQVERLSTYQRDYETFEALFKKGLVTITQVTQRKDASLSAQQQLLDLEQAIHRHDLDIVAVRSELAQSNHELDATRAGQDKSQSALKGQRMMDMSLQGGRVVALKDGQVTSIEVKRGDVVTANQTLALIVPRRNAKLPQQVVLWVPSRAVGFVQPGNKVRIMFDAFPYQTFGAGTGRVSEISLAPIMPNEIPIPIDAREQMYKVTATLDRDTLEAYGKVWPLRAGMRLSADLVLDEKSLLGWLFDPITAMRKRTAS
jgi:membrane fusion protein